jgi:hypothetical protein
VLPFLLTLFKESAGNFFPFSHRHWLYLTDTFLAARQISAGFYKSGKPLGSD